jgi:hypothetical protein
MEIMELCEPCLVKYARCVGMSEVLRGYVRFIFNRMESKLEVIVVKESGSVRVVSKPLCSNLFDCNWVIKVSIETKNSSPPLCAI